VRSKFPCVRSSHGLCARVHAHSLEGTLLIWLSLSASMKDLGVGGGALLPPRISELNIRLFTTIIKRRKTESLICKSLDRIVLILLLSPSDSLTKV